MQTSENKVCPQCGAPLDATAAVCKYCGAEIAIASGATQQAPQYTQQASQYTQQAPQYTQAPPPQYVSAPQVGYTQPQVMPAYNTYNQKSKVTAGVLAILLGSFGIHKFYTGHIGLGLLYLIFCWAYIPGILGIIEGIVYLTSSDEKFNRKYVKHKN